MYRVINRFVEKKLFNLTTKLKEMLKQGKISKGITVGTFKINDAVARDGKPSTVKSVETIKNSLFRLSPKNEPIVANTKGWGCC